MKVRDGFVSNSSSSSFIIRVKPTVRCGKCGRGDPDFLGYLGSEHDGDEYISETGKVKILAYLKEHWCLDEARLAAIQTKMEDGKKGKLHLITLRNYGRTLDMLTGGELQNIEIIESLGD